jgi:hypothetical protein
MNFTEIQERITQRADGRKAARTACALVDITDMPEQVQKGFWLEMYSMIPDAIKCPEERTMTDEAAKQFENTTIEFGIHEGKAYKDIPIDYLTWIVDSQVTLRLYLRTNRGKQRIEANQ